MHQLRYLYQFPWYPTKNISNSIHTTRNRQRISFGWAWNSMDNGVKDDKEGDYLNAVSATWIIQINFIGWTWGKKSRSQLWLLRQSSMMSQKKYSKYWYDKATTSILNLIDVSKPNTNHFELNWSSEEKVELQRLVNFLWT